MSRSLRHFLPVDGDPTSAVPVFLGDPERWLTRARHVGPNTYRLAVGPKGLERPVELTLGSAWHVGSTWWRSCSWEPVGAPGDAVAVARLLPGLDAELGLDVRDGRATLILDGRYDPPGGLFGDAIDAVALGRVARSTVERLLAGAARHLSGAALVGT